MGFSTSFLIVLAFFIVFSGIISSAAAFAFRRKSPAMPIWRGTIFSAVAGTAAVFALAIAIAANGANPRDWLTMWEFEDLASFAFVLALNSVIAGSILRKATPEIDPRVFD